MMARYLFLAVATVILLACVEGDNDSGQTSLRYLGLTSLASLDPHNARAFSITAPEGINAQLAQNSIPLPLAANAAEKPGVQIVLQHTAVSLQRIHSEPQLPLGASRTEPGSCGGDMVVSTDGTNGSVIFNQFCIMTDYGNVIVQGLLVFEFTQSYIEFDLQDLEITRGEKSIIVNASIVMSGSNFETAVRYEGADGNVKQLLNFSVDQVEGAYIVSGRLYLPDYGYVSVTTPTGLQLGNCENHKPNSGSLHFNGDNSSATVTFLDCSNYTVTYDGLESHYRW